MTRLEWVESQNPICGLPVRHEGCGGILHYLYIPGFKVHLAERCGRCGRGWVTVWAWEVASEHGLTEELAQIIGGYTLVGLGPVDDQ